MGSEFGLKLGFLDALGLTLAIVCAWMLANHKTREDNKFAGQVEPRNTISPMSEVDSNGVKVIGFSLKRTF